MANKKNDSLDACPFPPDGEPPGKSLSTNMLEAMDWLFDNWRNTLLLMSLISMVLIYSLFMTPLTLIALSSTPDTWNQELSLDYPDEFENYTWLYDSEPDTSQTKSIILEGNEVMEIIDQTFHLDGYILLRDNSKLILHNSQLAVNPTRVIVDENQYSEYAHILLMNSSQIQLDNSVIIAQDGRFILGVIDEAQVVLNSSYIVDGTLWFDDSTNLDADDSYIKDLYVYGSLRGSAYNTSFDLIRYENRWRAGLIDPRIHSDGSLSMQDCTIDKLSLNFIGGSITIDESIVGHHESWNPYVDWGYDGYVFNVTLMESEVRFYAYIYVLDGICTVSGVDDMFSVFGVNSTLNIIDSSLAAIGCSSGSKLIMNNSIANNVDFLKNYIFEREVRGLNEYDVSQGYISRSNIQSLGFGDGVVVTFDQVKVDVVNANSPNVVVKGDVVYGQDMSSSYRWYEIQEFEPLLYTQEYRVETIGELHMVPNVDLILVDESGETVWEGLSDEKGEAFFNISFCNYYPLYEPYEYVSNYDETWSLVASLGSEFVESEVRFRVTGSPIVIKFSEPNIVQRMKFSSLSWASLGAIAVILVVKLLKKD